jgi:Zn-dependent protease
VSAPTPGPLPSSSAGGASELDRLKTIVARYFPVYETRLGPQSVLFAVHADPATLEARFDDLRRELWTLQYIPVLRRQSGEDFLEVVRRPTVKPFRSWVNLLLLAGTVSTTTFAGALIWLAYVGGSTLSIGDFAYGALYFSAPVLTILGLHELAHYAMARRHHVEASLPYFIPVPPPLLFGTLGAFISIRQPFPDKKALFDIGVAGPLAGFAAAIPIALVGLHLSISSPALPLSYCGPSILGVDYGNLLLGPSLFWTVLSLFFPSSIVSLNPLALAGWVGILVTAINLLPAGQLDGGHVFRALFGDRVRYVSYAAVILLFGLGLFYTGWLFFAILILLLGVRHPPPLNDFTRLDLKRYAVGLFAIGVLVTGFVITPLATPAGVVSLESNTIGYPNSPPPGAAIAANFTTTVVNGDPVVHGFTFSTAVTNVSVRSGNGTEYLTGTALTAWLANVSWTYHLPNGEVYSARGGSAALPESEYVTVNATSGANSVLLLVSFSNSEAAEAAVVSLTVDEFCEPSGTGVVSTTFPPSWS